MAKILLVEDDNNLRDIYGERLMAEGYDIVSANDGEEALQTAVTQKPDLIISDVMMPKISGFDMLDILRQTPETKDIRIIMMTALSQAEDKSRADKLGADKYLVKSQVTLEDVARVVHDILGDLPEAENTQESFVGASYEVAQPVVEPITEVVAPVVPIAPAPESVQTPVAQPTIQVAVPQPVQNTANPAQPSAQSSSTLSQPAQANYSTNNPTVFSEPANSPQTTPAQAVLQAPVTQPVQDNAAQQAQPQSPVDPTVPTVSQPPTAPSNPVVVQTNVAPVLNPISGAATDTTPVINNVITNTTEEEISEVAKQISSFVNSSSPIAKHTEPINEPTEQDLIHAQNANEDPKIVAANLATNVNEATQGNNTDTDNAKTAEDQTLAPNPFLNKDFSIPNYSVDNPEPVSNRKKIITPINDVSAPDIHALYEQEMATEAANSPVAQNYPPINNPEPEPVLEASPTLLATATHNVPSANDMADQTINPIVAAQQPVLQQIPTDLPPELETLDISAVTGITENPNITFDDPNTSQAPAAAVDQPSQPQDNVVAPPNQATPPENDDLNNPANFAL